MQRRKFGREFKVEAIRLIKDRGVSVAQAARDLDVHKNVLRKWVRKFGADPAQDFPGQGQVKPEQLEIDRLRREVTKLNGLRRLDRPPKKPASGAFIAWQSSLQARPKHTPALSKRLKFNNKLMPAYRLHQKLLCQDHFKKTCD